MSIDNGVPFSATKFFLFLFILRPMTSGILWLFRRGPVQRWGSRVIHSFVVDYFCLLFQELSMRNAPVLTRNAGSHTLLIVHHLLPFLGRFFSNFWNRVLYVATFWENGNQVSCMVTPVPPNFHSLKRWSLKYVSDDGGPHPLIAVSSLTSAPFKVLIGWVLTQTIRMTETICLHARNEWNFVQ